MTLFNYSKWIAKEVTGPKNIDKKIFVVGPAGSGKSMTGLKLAHSVARWISYYNHNESFDHADKYFKFDSDHIAVIDTGDLIHVMTTPLERNSVKVIDDCGASVGFTNRRSMSKENLDIVSIYGTNRTRNGVTIICIQDTDFGDVRLRKLANEIIDLNDYYQVGPFRVAKLSKIKMDKRAKNGIRPCRFMTYEHGVWVTQEGIACTLPPAKLKDEYDKLREVKESANAEMINKKYNQLSGKIESVNKNDKFKCPSCKSADTRYSKKTMSCYCRRCGAQWGGERETAYNYKQADGIKV